MKIPPELQKAVDDAIDGKSNSYAIDLLNTLVSWVESKIEGMEEEEEE